MILQEEKQRNISSSGNSGGNYESESMAFASQRNGQRNNQGGGLINLRDGVRL